MINTFIHISNLHFKYHPVFLSQKATGWIYQLPRNLMEVWWKSFWCTCQELLPSVGSWHLLCCCCQSCITALKKSCLNEEIWNNQSIRDVLSDGKTQKTQTYQHWTEAISVLWQTPSIDFDMSCWHHRLYPKFQNRSCLPRSRFYWGHDL